MAALFGAIVWMSSLGGGDFQRLRPTPDRRLCWRCHDACCHSHGHGDDVLRHYSGRLVQNPHLHCRRSGDGMVLGLSFMVAAHWILQNKPPQIVDKWFRKLQLLSAAAYSLGMGQRRAKDDGHRRRRTLHRRS